jgi:hypothetical protein
MCVTLWHVPIGLFKYCRHCEQTTPNMHGMDSMQQSLTGLMHQVLHIVQAYSSEKVIFQEILIPGQYTYDILEGWITMEWTNLTGELLFGGSFHLNYIHCVQRYILSTSSCLLRTIYILIWCHKHLCSVHSSALVFCCGLFFPCRVHLKGLFISYSDDNTQGFYNLR